jgi:hypothetical protein
MTEEQERMLRLTAESVKLADEWLRMVLTELRGSLKTIPQILFDLCKWQDLELAPRPEKEIRKEYKKLIDMGGDRLPDSLSDDDIKLQGAILELRWGFPYLFLEKKENEE